MHSLDTPFELTDRARRRAPGTAAKTHRYGAEAARVRQFVESQQEQYAKQRGCCGPCCCVLSLVCFEIKLLVLSVVLGPFMLWRAALSLAHGVAYPASGEDGVTLEGGQLGEARAEGGECSPVGDVRADPHR